MAFDVFQTATATMSRKEADSFGDDSVVESFTVDIDPVLGRKRVFTDENEEITGLSTVISPHDSINLEFNNYTLDYNGREYQIEEIIPQYDIGTDRISHYEVVLR